MHYVEVFSIWLKATPFSGAILNYGWIWPTCEILHFIGMAFLIGIAGLLDLRILGLGKGIPIGLIHQLLPWGIGGFVINLITGILFFSGDPFQYVHNIAFQLKLLFIAVAGLNVLYFYGAGVLVKVEALGPEEDAPIDAKIVAGVSLAAWIAVMYMGRMLPFLGDAF